MMFQLILVFSIALILSFISHQYLVKNSRRYTIRKANISAIRWDSQTKPILGGITFYVIFTLIFIVCLFFSDSVAIKPFQMFGVFLVLTLSFFMGFADDLLNTPPSFKFVVQAVNAFILIYFGIYIQVTSYVWINYTLTFFWVVGIMNSINMIDNMDAISSTITLSILTGLFINAWHSPDSGNLFYLFSMTGVGAALISFLYFNWHPSKMYMGDNGSQFIGALLAILAIHFAWNQAEGVVYYNTTRQFVILIILFLVPITDTASVTINRLMKGKSPFIGGRDHTTHHLSYLGFTDRQVAIILACISIINMVISVYISNYIYVWETIHTVMAVGYILLVSGTLFLLTRITKPPVK